MFLAIQETKYRSREIQSSCFELQIVFKVSVTTLSKKFGSLLLSAAQKLTMDILPTDGARGTNLVRTCWSFSILHAIGPVLRLVEHHPHHPSRIQYMVGSADPMKQKSVLCRPYLWPPIPRIPAQFHRCAQADDKYMSRPLAKHTLPACS